MNRKHGYFSGYAEYRYGASKPLPIVRIYKGESRRQIVQNAITVLRRWRLSEFENEGVCIANIRSSLCLKGHRWSRSDHEARCIVDEAFRLMGVERPSWERGQPEYALASEYCNWCCTPMPEEYNKGTRAYRYCCSECANAARLVRLEQEGWAESVAGAAARRFILREQQPAKSCNHCGRSFRPNPHQPQAHCSFECWNDSRHYLDPRSCPTCDKPFQPADHSQIHCSQACGWRARRKVKVIVCLHCTKPFPQKDARNKLCSLACSTAYQVARLPERVCDCCGTPFKPKKIVQKYCSKACGVEMANRRKRKAEIIVIHLASDRFDNLFTAPINRDCHQLTPNRFDRMAAYSARYGAPVMRNSVSL